MGSGFGKRPAPVDILDYHPPPKASPVSTRTVVSEPPSVPIRGRGRLLAEQLALRDEKTKLIADQVSKRSKWDSKGASALKAALAHVRLLDAAWLARVADSGGALPHCDDVPAEAMVTLAELERWDDPYSNNLAVLVVCCPELDPDVRVQPDGSRCDPDAHGEQLRRISFVLKAFVRAARDYGGGKVGVLWEYSSRINSIVGRGAEEQAGRVGYLRWEQAERALWMQRLHVWHRHPATHVLLVDDADPPRGPHEGEESSVQNGRFEGEVEAEGGRGRRDSGRPHIRNRRGARCELEACASGVVKDSVALIRLSQLSGDEAEYIDVIHKGKRGRPPPLAPNAFAARLKRGLASGELQLTHAADAPLLWRAYVEAFASEMRSAVALNFDGLGWDEDAGLCLCEALRHAHAQGGLRALHTLSLHYNGLGDRSMRALAALVAAGALPSLQTLALNGNPGNVAPVKEALAGRARAPLTASATSEQLFF